MYKGANNKDEISHLIKELGIDKTIDLHEERISYAKTHPRNSFFIGVIQDSEAKIKTLKQIKNETKTI